MWCVYRYMRGTALPQAPPLGSCHLQESRSESYLRQICIHEDHYRVQCMVERWNVRFMCMDGLWVVAHFRNVAMKMLTLCLPNSVEPGVQLDGIRNNHNAASVGSKEIGDARNSTSALDTASVWKGM